jgi:hypothetical protein
MSGRTMLRAAAVLAAVLAVAGLVRAAPRAPDGFPHAAHERLFPICQSCHLPDERGAAFPAPADCAQCHDGVRRARVEWTGYAPRASNLRFSHARHLAAIGTDREDAALGAECRAWQAGRGERG